MMSLRTEAQLPVPNLQVCLISVFWGRLGAFAPFIQTMPSFNLRSL